MKTVVIVQARMSSTRLPGKVLIPVRNTPLLEHQLERIRRAREADEVCVATTTGKVDDPIAALCSRLGVALFRGPEEDVLSRYVGAAERSGADVVVRVTADCPLIDPEIVDRVVRFYKDHPGEYDYVSNVLRRTYPRGMDTETFSREVLEEVSRLAASPEEREHVTLRLYTRPDRYRLANVEHGEDLSGHRWTVDTPEDLELVRRILEALLPTCPRFTMEDVLGVLARNPEWSALNAGVEQKRTPAMRAGEEGR